MLKINEQIPEIELEAYHEDEIKKIDISKTGKWLVLLFYPADFTFICPTELTHAAEMYEQFQKEGAEIMSISTDTAFAHKAWFDNSDSIKKIKYPMLADPTGEMCKAFGTYIESEGLSQRASYIISPEGKVKSIEIHDNSIGRNAEEIFRKLQAAKYVSEHDGLVCPASWKPGGDTLKPGVDLVGKL